MKIFLNLISGTLGGQITRAKAILERIDNFDNIEIIVVKNIDVLNEFNNKKITFINVNHGFGLIKLVRRFFWENFIMPNLIKKLKPNIFLTFSNYLPLIKLDIPTFVGISNLAPFSSIALKEESLINRIKFFLLKKSILNSSKKATKVIALSHTAVDVLFSNGINKDKIFLNPIGVDKFWSENGVNEQIETQYGINKSFYLYVSHFYRYKNHINLINSYASLNSKIKSKRQLVLIGRPENKRYFEEIKNLIIKLNLVNNIILIPGLNSNDLRYFYQKSFLFIFCSLVENSPNILLEAMSASCPIITLKIPPMSEYCSSCAEFYDEKHHTSLVNVLNELDSNIEKINKMRLASQNQSKNFSWDSFVNSLFIKFKEYI